MKQSAKQKEQNDPVQPNHYKSKDGNLELIDVIEAYGLQTDFCRATALTYIFRAGEKSDSDIITDLKKAVWYIERRIKELEEGFD